MANEMPLRGYLMICDAKSSDGSSWCMETLSAWMEDVIALTGLICISGPHIYEHETSLTGFAVIAESHIAVHVRPRTGECFADVFSCKPFEFAAILEATTRHFGPFEAGSVRWYPREAPCA